MTKAARPHNMDRINGHWVIYDAAGYAFRATGGRGSLWTAYPSHSVSMRDCRAFMAKTLTELAAKVGASQEILEAYEMPGS